MNEIPTFTPIGAGLVKCNRDPEECPERHNTHNTKINKYCWNNESPMPDQEVFRDAVYRICVTK